MIFQLAQAGHTDRQIAALVGFRPRTVRKWRRRGQQQGVRGLSSTLGRPKSGPLGTYPRAMTGALAAWRRAHSGWGPKTLRAELEGCPDFQRMALPALSSIARWLKAEGLIRRYQRHRELPQAERGARAAHEEWGMDARGPESVPGVGVVALIDLNDLFSKVKLLSYPCLLGRERATRHPTTEDYQLALRLAFADWGLPDRLAVDRESVFYDNTTKSPFPTRLHLWLRALGVGLSFGRPGRPTDQAATERSHQTWQQQVLAGQRFPDWDALHRALDLRRDFLNRRLPCSTLGDLPPLVAHPEAQSPRRPYRPEWEAELLDLSRVYDYLGQGRWFRHVNGKGTFGLGTVNQTVGVAWAKQEVDVTFDPTERRLVCRSLDERREKRIALRGVSAATLMGEAAPLAQFDQFQLLLPFSPSEWRVARLRETQYVTI